jgi:hypothetical protein
VVSGGDEATEDASDLASGINGTKFCDTLVNSDRISISPFENCKSLTNDQARQPHIQTEMVKVREPFTDVFTPNESHYEVAD